MAQHLPRISDPQHIPVIGTDGHLPPVAREWLTAAAVRDRFGLPLAFEPEIPGDGKRFESHLDRELTHASVLVPLVVRDEGLQVLLTQRTAHLRDHAGQISFPGGRAEPDDADAVATALRETEEEVGLARAHIEVIGTLPHYTTVTGYIVTPVVSLVRPGFALALDSFEVAEAFEVPLQFLMTPANHRRHSVDIEGQTRQFLSMPWLPPGADPAKSPYFIWGATAAMLRNFYRFLAR